MKAATRTDSVMFIIRVSQGWQFFMLGKWSVGKHKQIFELSVIFLPPTYIAPSLHSYSDIFSNPELLIIPLYCVCARVWEDLGGEWRGRDFLFKCEGPLSIVGPTYTDFEIMCPEKWEDYAWLFIMCVQHTWWVQDQGKSLLSGKCFLSSFKRTTFYLFIFGVCCLALQVFQFSVRFRGRWIS